MAYNLKGIEYIALESLEVGEFHEAEDGAGKPSQVHLTFKIEGAPARMVFRFKSCKPVDSLIVALITHSKNVWPD